MQSNALSGLSADALFISRLYPVTEAHSFQAIRSQQHLHLGKYQPKLYCLLLANKMLDISAIHFMMDKGDATMGVAALAEEAGADLAKAI